MELFKQKICSTIAVNEAEIAEILSAFDRLDINKGENLLDINAFCTHYYFLEKGLLRFVSHIKDKEETSWVVFEGIFFTEMISLKSKKPTIMRFEALENATILAINEADLIKLCDKVPAFEKYLRLTWEDNLFHILQMKLMQQFNSAKERYELLRKDETLMQRIPQKYLASILGITPYSLSRLRSPKKA